MNHKIIVCLNRLGALLIILVSLLDIGFAQSLSAIAYTRPDWFAGPDANQLWIVNSDGTNNHRLSPVISLGGIAAGTASLGRPAWSKDGRQIAADAILSGGDPVLSGALGTSTNVLVVFSAATGQGRAVFDTSTGTGPVALDWFYKSFSPDGKRLAYASNQLDYNEYGIVNTDGTGRIFLGFRDLTSEAFGMGIDWSPRTDQWGNYGKLLVVSDSYTIFSDPSCAGAPRTFARLKFVAAVYDGMDVASRGLTMPPQQPCTLLSYTTTNDLYPIFSPDGMRVAFVRTTIDSSGQVLNSTIMTLSLLDGSKRTVLYLPQERVDNLTWSPDGTRLMFDRTQMIGFYPNPLGVWKTASMGGGIDTLFLNPPAFAAAWQ
jgi:Tol biopolymer transport system component